jgi:hypothetical protein
VDRSVDVIEVYDELAELVLGVLDLAGDLGALGNQAGEDVWIGHLSLPRTGTAGWRRGCTGAHASPLLRECGQPAASLTAPATLRLRSAFSTSAERFLLPNLANPLQIRQIPLGVFAA